MDRTKRRRGRRILHNTRQTCRVIAHFQNWRCANNARHGARTANASCCLRNTPVGPCITLRINVETNR
eukprot:3901757-Lingulodinium_polyedra.AAC.1